MDVFPIFRSGAVWPQGRPFAFWGEASPGEKLSLSLCDKTFHAEADSDGHFRFELPAFKAGGPHTYVLEGENESLRGENILFGEVFLLSGQSNMQLPVSRCRDLMPPYFEGLSDERIRELRVGIAPSFDLNNRHWPEPSLWRSLSPETLPEFGALGLAFAKTYVDEADIPIGLINCAVGGTPVESWLPPEALSDDPSFAETFEQYKDPAARDAVDGPYYNRLEDWLGRAKAAEAPEEGFVPFGDDVFPDMFFDTPYRNQHGVFWLRCRINLSAEEASSPASRLDLGCLYYADQTYVNGEFVGQTDYEYPPRRYVLRKGLLQEGENEILIRLIVPRGCGGAVPGKFYGLILNEETLPLGGDIWEIARGPELEEMELQAFWDRIGSTNYLSYLKPMEGFPFRAALWYQGESNDADPENYERRFKQLIRSYRKQFGPKLPFIYVQLTRYDDPARQVPENSWAVIREAQRKALALQGTAMVVSLDVGEANDLHPQDKWSLGSRAFWAYRALRLGEEDGGLSPELSSWVLAKDKLRLYFRQTGDGLWFDGDNRLAFCYQDAEGHEAPARVLDFGDNFIDLERPPEDLDAAETSLYFLWANNPPYVYIRNGEGLPASPFMISLGEDGTA